MGLRCQWVLEWFILGCSLTILTLYISGRDLHSCGVWRQQLLICGVVSRDYGKFNLMWTLQCIGTPIVNNNRGKTEDQPVEYNTESNGYAVCSMALTLCNTREQQGPHWRQGKWWLFFVQNGWWHSSSLSAMKKDKQQQRSPEKGEVRFKNWEYGLKLVNSSFKLRVHLLLKDMVSRGFEIHMTGNYGG